MSLGKEFKQFAFKGNVVDLAVGVIIGAAFGKVVSAVVDDVFMPVIALALGATGESWRTATITPAGIKVGHLAATLLDFLIVALVVFLVVVKFMGALRRKEAAPPAAPASKPCGECLEPIPLAARRCRACTSVVAAVVLGLVLLGPPAAEAAEPKFEYGKADEVKDVKKVEWKALVKFGAILATGNSRSTTFAASAQASRKAAGNRFTAEGGVAYAESEVFLFVDANGNGVIDPPGGGVRELTRESTVTTQSANARLRYDRFFTTHNSGYVTASILSDEPAGKELVAGGQLGYSRQLHKSERHLSVAEIGYDFAYEEFVGEMQQPVSIHSARAFAGHTIKVGDATGGFANVEVLVNLNDEPRAIADEMGGKGVDALDDTRLNAKAGVSATLGRNLAFTFSFTLRYDQAPAVRPAGKIPFAMGYTPLADELDGIIEAAFTYNIL